MNKKILVVAWDFPPEVGGIHRYTFELCKSLWNRGIKITVLAKESKNSKRFDKKMPFEVIRLKKSKGFLKFLEILKKTIEITRKEKIDNVLVMNWFPQGIPIWMARKLSKLPFFPSFNYILFTYALEIIEPANSKIKKYFIKKIIEDSSKIITVSKYTKKIVSEIYKIPPTKIKIIVGIDPTKYKILKEKEVKKIKEKYGLKNKKILLTVSSLEYSYKGQDIVIRVLPKLLKSDKNIHYIVVGEGKNKKRLVTLARKLGVEQNVSFLGKVSEKELVELYNVCDIFVMPSGGNEKKGEVEGLGLVYLEANLCKKPTIGVDIGGVSDAIINRKTGILLKSKKEEELYRAIIDLLKDKEKRKRLGEKGYNWVRDKFNWNKNIERLLKELN